VHFLWCHDIQHNENQHNDTQHKDIQYNDTQHKVFCNTQHNDIQHKWLTAKQHKYHNDECHSAKCHILFIDMLSVVMLNIIMLSVMAPITLKMWKNGQAKEGMHTQSSSILCLCSIPRSSFDSRHFTLDFHFCWQHFGTGNMKSYSFSWSGWIPRRRKPMLEQSSV